MHKRNTQGIKAAAQRKREEALERTEKAISTLIREQTPINFNTVSRAAGVSTSWLYGEHDLCDRIKFLRKQGKSKRQSPKTRASDASKDAMIRTLKDKNRQLRDEVRALKSELERAYGKALTSSEESRRSKAEANQLRKRLAASGTMKEVYQPSARTASAQHESNAEMQIEALGIPLNSTLRTLIQRSEPTTIENAAKAFQAQRSTILNPGGWLRKALAEAWEATEPIKQSEKDSSQSKVSTELAEWYPKAVENGFLLDDPINLLPVVGSEIQVKIRRPDRFGAPYTVSPWRAAKLEWEAVQGID